MDRVQKNEVAPLVVGLLMVATLLLPDRGEADVYMVRDSRGIVYFTNSKSATAKSKILKTYTYSGAGMKVKPVRYAPIPRYNTFSRRYDRLIEASAARHRLDPKLVKAVIKVESDFNPYSVSRTGARGLMQLMPLTAKEMKVRYLFDPEENIEGGTKYLRKMLDRFGNSRRMALAAYNAGPTAVQKAGGVPRFPETIRYIKKVNAAYRSLMGGRYRHSGSAYYYTYRDRNGRIVLSDRY